MKKLAIILGSVFLASVIAYPVFAHGPGWGRGQRMMGYGGGPGYCGNYRGGDARLTAEQRDELDKLYREFYDETSTIRNELWTKSDELNRLLETSDPDPNTVKALQKEISDLRTKLDEKRLDFDLKARKINPDARRSGGFNRGYGRHMQGYGLGMRGYGPGMGYDRPRVEGFGPGYCWE